MTREIAHADVVNRLTVQDLCRALRLAHALGVSLDYLASIDQL